MLINDKVDAVYIPDSPSRIKATDYNQIKNEIQECITEAGLTPTKDVIQLPQALKILTAQSGAEEVAKIEAAGQEQLDAVNSAGQTQTAAVNAAGQTQMNNINTAGAQAVQNAQDAAATATSKAAEAADSAENAAESASSAAESADDASNSATAASSSATSAASSATQAAGSATAASNSAGTANTKAGEAASSASAALTSQQAAASSASSAGTAKTAAESAKTAAQSAQNAAESAQSAAETAKTQASSSASAAANSASAASASATLAQSWAVKTGGAVSGGEYSAKYHAQQAASSAAEASTAKTAAQTAQSAAESAKTQAAASATSASQSAIDAANSAASARGLQIGAVYFSQSSLATDNPGGLPLWTGEYFSNGSSLYPDFYAWVKSHTELCKSKTEYDAAISTYGECPYYVVDEVAGSLRLPKLVNYVKMANATNGITQSGAGLPDHTHELYVSDGYGNDGGNTKNQTGYIRNAVYKSQTGTSWVKKSSVYGNSDTVTPAHTTLYPWVYAFNSAVSASEAQAAEFTGALSGKAAKDLSNGSKATQANINNIMPDDMDYVVDSYSDEEGNWYRVYKSGWVEQGGEVLNIPASSGRDITFLKPFANTLYTALCTPNNTTSDRGDKREGWGLYKKANTYCQMFNNSETKTVSFSWYACGQGA